LLLVILLILPRAKRSKRKRMDWAKELKNHQEEWEKTSKCRAKSCSFKERNNNTSIRRGGGKKRDRFGRSWGKKSLGTQSETSPCRIAEGNVSICAIKEKKRSSDGRKERRGGKK